LRQRKIERGWSALDGWTKEYGSLPEFAQVAGVLSVMVAQRPAKAA
jgi:hypothetical protein